MPQDKLVTLIKRYYQLKQSFSDLEHLSPRASDAAVREHLSDVGKHTDARLILLEMAKVRGEMADYFAEDRGVLLS